MRIIKETETAITINSENSGPTIFLRTTFCICFIGTVEDDRYFQYGKICDKKTLNMQELAILHLSQLFYSAEPLTAGIIC